MNDTPQTWEERFDALFVEDRRDRINTYQFHSYLNNNATIPGLKSFIRDVLTKHGEAERQKGYEDGLQAREQELWEAQSKLQ